MKRIDETGKFIKMCVVVSVFSGIVNIYAN